MTLSLLRGSVRLNTLLPPRPDLLCSRVRVRPVSPGTPQVAGFIQTDRPFFDVHVELDLPHVKMSPPLADIQTAINRCSRAVLGCSKALTVWKSDATAVRGSSIYEVVTRDREVIRVVLLLAGSVEGAKRQVHEFLSTFMKYEYLWVDNMADAYAQFMAKNPTLEDFEAELKMYVNVKDDIVRRQHAALPEEARSPGASTYFSTDQRTLALYRICHAHSRIRAPRPPTPLAGMDRTASPSAIRSRRSRSRRRRSSCACRRSASSGSRSTPRTCTRRRPRSSARSPRGCRTCAAPSRARSTTSTTCATR